jgi:hypothetical protein
MKKLILFISLFISLSSFAQTGDPKVDKMLKEMQQKQNSKAIISFTFNGKTYKDKASFMETDKKTFSIGSSLIADDTANTMINLIVGKKKSGIYTIVSGNQNSSVVTINGKYYQFTGTVNLVVKGKKVSGAFTGELYEIKKGKSKPDPKSSGKVSGSFME